MKGQAKISYTSVLVGQRRVQGSIQVPESMVGIHRQGELVNIDRSAAVSMLKKFLIKQEGLNATMDLIDMTVTVLLDDGRSYMQALSHGFKALPEVLGVPVPMLPPLDVPKAPAAPARPAELEKPMSKYQAKRQQQQPGVATEAQPVHPQQKRRFEWREPHDAQDAIPDSELTPRQRAHRKALEERAENQAFAQFANKGRR